MCTTGISTNSIVRTIKTGRIMIGIKVLHHQLDMLAEKVNQMGLGIKSYRVRCLFTRKEVKEQIKINGHYNYIEVSMILNVWLLLKSMYVCVYMYVCMCVYVCMYVCMYVCTCMYVCACMYVHVYMRMFYACTCMCT